MRKTKKLENRIAVLETRMASNEKKGMIASAVAGGVVVVGTIVSIVERGMLKKSINTISTSVERVEDFIMESIYDEAEDEDEEEGDSSSSSYAAAKKENTFAAADEKSMKNLVQSLEALDFSDRMILPTEILRGFVDLAFDESADRVSFTHCEPTILSDGNFLSPDFQCIKFNLYTENAKYVVDIERRNNVNVKMQ